MKAPFEGIVTARNTDIGGMVNAGSGNPLFIVARINPLRVYINVPQSMAQDATVGVTADLKFNEFPERTFPGRSFALLERSIQLLEPYLRKWTFPTRTVSYFPALTCRFISAREVTGNRY